MAQTKKELENLLQERLRPHWGKTLSSFGAQKNLNHKGWAGECLEEILEVSNKNGAGADFPEWGIELKTLPLNENFQVLENTFLSKISLPFYEGRFEKSALYQKIRCIFWVPLIASRGAPLIERKIGQGFLWQMSPDELEIFEQDWDELAFFLRSGQFASISAHLGTALHIRPKAADSRDKVTITTLDGRTTLVPLGFYLRRSFTQQLINQRFS